MRAESRALRAELLAALTRTLDSGVYLFGPEVAALESELASVVGVSNVVGVGSGTTAIQLALMAHGIGSGDEVIVPAASFYATAMAVHLAGATPVFVDVDPEHYLIDPDYVTAAITPRTRAVIAVHLYGCPAPMRELRDIADRHGLILHEDMAQAIGATVAGRPVGTWGDSAALSFYPTKNVGALGDAGAVATRDPEVAARIRSMRFLGFTGERDHFVGPGLSGRMDEIQASALRVKLRHRHDQQARRLLIAERYRDYLPPALCCPPAARHNQDVAHLFVVRTPQRDALRAHLQNAGIGTEIHYRVPLHRQPLFHHNGRSLPCAEQWAHEVLSLPLHPYLAPLDQDTIIDAVLSFPELQTC